MGLQVQEGNHTYTFKQEGMCQYSWSRGFQSEIAWKLAPSMSNHETAELCRFLPPYTIPWCRSSPKWSPTLSTSLHLQTAGWVDNTRQFRSTSCAPRFCQTWCRMASTEQSCKLLRETVAVQSVDTRCWLVVQKIYFSAGMESGHVRCSIALASCPWNRQADQAAHWRKFEGSPSILVLLHSERVEGILRAISIALLKGSTWRIVRASVRKCFLLFTSLPSFPWPFLHILALLH